MNAIRLSVLILLSICASAHAKLVNRPVPYTHGGVQLEGYLAYNDAQHGPRPGVLIVHEWWGLNEYAKKRADDLAALGYVAFALDMYGKGITTTDPKKAGELSGQFKGSDLLRTRARAGLDILAGQSNVDKSRIAAIGYCFGGTTVLELAYSGAPLTGVVSFHGSLTAPSESDRARIKAAILVCHGADDALVPDDQVAAFQKAMRGSKVDWQLIFYGGAVHAFTNPAADKVNIPSVGYDAKSDRRSWSHMRLFFDEIFDGRPGAAKESR